MNNVIRHKGIVASVDGQHIQVRIVQMTACAACKVASACHASEKKEKLVDVFQTERRLSVGDEVTVVASTSVAGKALILGFGYPLALILTVLVVMLVLGFSEGVAALAMLLSLVPYYAVLWALRRRWARQLTFQIE